ncbi:Bug family tripartite tricarboxylate transporter substrate binding protein [Caenimonas terrae]|uniref:Bug family tripartite tricarboxylate transporter substrate binding protein n=1 Tax=Caenimonas terrae TaxID=696074 RepID=A0ABW0ND24_9BURK
MKAVSRRRLLQGTALALGACTLPAFAQAGYPDRPIKLVVPFPAGALTDTLGRMVAEKLRPVLGQPIVVENRPGAGTLLGASQVAKSAPDGYTLIVATSTTLAIAPAMFTTPPAVAADFIGVAMIGNVTLLLVTRPDLKARTLAELVALLRAQPSRYNFGSPGNGTMHQLLVEMIKTQEKVHATHVPYQGSMGALSDLMTGRIDFMFIDAVAGLPQIQAGKVNVIAVAGARRHPTLPQVATVAETYPRIDMFAWQTIAAPKATPLALVNRLNAEINKLLDTPEMHAALQRVGVEASPMSVAALNELIASDEKRFGDLVRAVGVKAN